MKVVIIEDELASCRKLERMLLKYPFEITTTISSVKNAIKWFQNNPQPDLIFLDIHLSDGLCFEIFNHVTINSLIIFTTAYHEFSIQAFEYNSISYLLKPINALKLEKAIEKAQKNSLKTEQLNEFKNQLQNENSFKKRIPIKIGSTIKILEITNVNYFYSFENATFANANNINYTIDYSLSNLEKQINPKYFFRINRSHILHINSIQKVSIHTNNRLKIYLHNTTENLIVSRERVKYFKKWINT